ncbi:TadE/TadG family type IV pilus assembly protein [Methylobacterium nigriterrae]|uniref:TadE/TadG family type IV pilus assembly protein n=1 Tax=Methylobacterium nigriterrae TaxID=3127512 RepID=UPI0030137DD1
MPPLARIRAQLRRIVRERSGQVALTFGLALVPLLFATGATIDYGRRNAAKVRLDAALDAAVLAVTSQKVNTISATALASVQTQFLADAARVPGVTVTSIVPAPIGDGTTVGLTASYTATVRTTLGSLMGVRDLAISGTASGTRNLSQYIDYYLLLDNSPSMGLAATSADISNMQQVTSDKCAFACHEHTFDAQGNVTGDNLNDHYHIAQKYNIKLRIHVLRDAVKSLVDRAKSSMLLPQQYRMEMWTFSDFQTKISSLTTNLDQTKSDAGLIDLAYGYRSKSANQTSYERALARMNGVVPAGGSGATQAEPIRFLFFVTDGVQDTPVDAGGVSDPGSGGFVNSNRFISPINPATCQAMKDKGIRIGIIYTTYLPLYDNPFYNKWVKPFESGIAPRLQACATDGLFFPVETDGSISVALQKLFDASVASVRLTN